MAVTHITFSDQLPDGRNLARSMQMTKEGLALFLDTVEVAQTMKDGGAAGEYLRARFGFASVEDAVRAVETLETLRDKFAAVISDMVSVFRQFGPTGK